MATDWGAVATDWGGAATVVCGALGPLDPAAAAGRGGPAQNEALQAPRAVMAEPGRREQKREEVHWEQVADRCCWKSARRCSKELPAAKGTVAEAAAEDLAIAPPVGEVEAVVRAVSSSQPRFARARGR